MMAATIFKSDPEKDHSRVRYALQVADPDLDQGLFRSDSPVRTVNREAVLLAGGGRALLMQIAHPKVAEGVAHFSSFESDPLGRLNRTLDLTLAIVFGSAREAIRSVRIIEAMHRRVQGQLTEKIGPFGRGTSYDATDPALLFWVQATLIDSAIATYSRFVQPISSTVRARFYEESKITARLFGIPQEHIPDTVAHFDHYIAEMVASADLAIGTSGARVAASIIDPPLPPGLRQLAGSGRILTEGLLPARLRDLFGFEWSAARERRLNRIAALSRRTLPLLPASLRYFPRARGSQRKKS